MIPRLVFLLALTSAALALPSPFAAPHASIGALSSTLHPDYTFTKRQTSNDASDLDAVTAYAELVQRVAQGGQCRSECLPWANSIRSCNAQGGGNTAVGICACGEGLRDDMRTCSECFDGENDTVDDFAGVCDRSIASISANPSMTLSNSAALPSASSTADQATSISGDSPSQTSAPASGAGKSAAGAGVALGWAGLAVAVLA